MNNPIRKSFSSFAILFAAMAISSSLSAATPQQEITNARQESQIWTSYALNPYLRGNDLKVTVQKGKAVLTGKVDEKVNKELANAIALGRAVLAALEQLPAGQQTHIQQNWVFSSFYHASLLPLKGFDLALLYEQLPDNWALHADALRASAEGFEHWRRVPAHQRGERLGADRGSAQPSRQGPERAAATRALVIAEDQR